MQGVFFTLTATQPFVLTRFWLQASKPDTEITIYVCPGDHFGNESSPQLWSKVGQGFLPQTNTYTTIKLDAVVRLAEGESKGVYLHADRPGDVRASKDHAPQQNDFMTITFGKGSNSTTPFKAVDSVNDRRSPVCKIEVERTSEVKEMELRLAGEIGDVVNQKMPELEGRVSEVEGQIDEVRKQVIDVAQSLALEKKANQGQMNKIQASGKESLAEFRVQINAMQGRIDLLEKRHEEQIAREARKLELMDAKRSAKAQRLADELQAAEAELGKKQGDVQQMLDVIAKLPAGAVMDISQLEQQALEAAAKADDIRKLFLAEEKIDEELWQTDAMLKRIRQQEEEAVRLTTVLDEVKKLQSQLTNFDGAKRFVVTSTSDRRRGRDGKLGAGMVNPQSGTRLFFPEHFVPTKDVRASIQACGKHGEADLDVAMREGEAKATTLDGILQVAKDRAAAVFAYTEEEPNIYADVVTACRASSALSQSMLEKIRDYLFYLDDGLKSCHNFVGNCYRCIDVRLPLAQYPEGQVITWQTVASASVLALEAAKFAKIDGSRLSGTILKIKAKNAKDVAVLSRYPSEAEVVFGFNSHFRVVKHLSSADDKVALLPDLSSYNLDDVVVIEMEQV